MATTCRGCGAPIVWKVSPAGRNIPCDPKRLWVDKEAEEAEEGERKTIVTMNGHVVTGRLVEAGTPGSVPGWESHFATCPKAASFRKRRGRRG